VACVCFVGGDCFHTSRCGVVATLVARRASGSVFVLKPISSIKI
jgi:hypothetical protein